MPKCNHMPTNKRSQLSKLDTGYCYECLAKMGVDKKVFIRKCPQCSNYIDVDLFGGDAICIGCEENNYKFAQMNRN